VFSFIIAGCLLVAWGSSGLFGQQQEEYHLRLKVETPKDNLLVGEPVELTFTLTNGGGQEVVLEGVFDYSAGYLQVFSDSTGMTDKLTERKWEYIFPSRHTTMFGSHKIRPGQSISHQAILLYDVKKKSYVLPQPGLYRIMAKFRFRIEGERKELVSNVLSIEVLEPQGNNAKALALWNDVEVFDAVQQFSGKLGTINRLKQLISIYPNSVYSQYARTTLKSLKDFVVNNPDSLYSKQENIRRALLEWNEEEASTPRDETPARKPSVTTTDNRQATQAGAFSRLLPVLFGVVVVITGVVILLLLRRKGRGTNL
jgi:hypothetical protein